MRAWLLPGYSDVSSMSLQDVPDPTPRPGEVVIAVQFAALNPADRYLSVGQYPAKPAFPHILGRDGVGTVTAVGDGVAGIHVGDTRLILRSDVGVNRPGTLAQRVAVDAAYTTPVPAGWTLEQAAAAPLVYVTAWQALTQWGDLPAGSAVLVTGASGGVGVATVQLAHALGHTVLALSRSREKAAHLRELGADHTFDPQDKAWRDAAKAALGKSRVDLAVDNIGGDLFNHVLDVMGMHGRISVVGRLAGPVPSFNTAALFFRRLRIGGVAIGTYTNEQSHAAWKNVLATLRKTGATPLVDGVFNFEDTKRAFDRLAEGPMGKVVVRVS
jgi:NADPH2:quinone reductase